MKLPIQAQSVMRNSIPGKITNRGIDPSIVKEYIVSRGFSGVNSCCDGSRQESEASIAANEKAAQIAGTAGISATVVDYEITSRNCKKKKNPITGVRKCSGSVGVKARIDIGI